MDDLKQKFLEYVQEYVDMGIYIDDMDKHIMRRASDVDPKCLRRSKLLQMAGEFFRYISVVYLINQGYGNYANNNLAIRPNWLRLESERTLTFNLSPGLRQDIGKIFVCVDALHREVLLYDLSSLRSADP